MASYQTTVTLVAPASGNVLLPNGSTVVTISLDVTAQAAVAAALAAQMANYVAQPATPAAGVLNRASDGTLTWGAPSTGSLIVQSVVTS
jgi:hypothetical protein